MITLRKIMSLAMLLGLFGISACTNEVVIPEAVSATRDDVGHYCRMIIPDHPGPKAQVFEQDIEKPLWFASVRDALFYNSQPGEAQNVLVVYVQDSSAILDWEDPPTDGPWLEATKAFYVINSKRRGGMGSKETVPFATRKAAEKFQAKSGGQIVTFSEIPKEYLTSELEVK